MELLFPLFVSFALSLFLTKLIIELRTELEWVLRSPSTDRWHRNPTPSFGGIAIFSSFAVSLLIFARPLSPDILKILTGGSLIFVLGLLDDIVRLPPYVKLAGQIAVACLMVILGVHVYVTGNPVLYIPLTIFWIVGITNAFNLLDNMDGLAGGTALISVFFMGFLSQLTGGAVAMTWTVLLVGALAGFLWFNRHPARIFMGDCGAQWIGFTIACLAVIDTWQNISNLFLMIATPILVLAVPIFDTALVTLNRKIQGRPLTQGGKDHSSHRLVALGLSEQQTVSVLWGLAIVFGLVAVFANVYDVVVWTLIAGSAVIFALVFGIFLADAAVDVKKAAPMRTTHRILNLDLMYKRRIVEILIDTLLIGGAYSLAYLLRYDWKLDSFLADQMARTLPIVVAAKLLAMLTFGLYRGLWTYIDFEGILRLVRVSLLASGAAVLAILGAYRFEGFSRTIFVIDFVLLFVAMLGTRSLLRLLRESIFAFPEQGVRLLVVGAGNTGHYLLQEIRRNRHWNLRPVALVDDDPRKKGKKILDIAIQGTCRDISRIVRERSVQRAVIAIQSISDEQLETIRKACEAEGVPCAVMRSLERTLVRELVGDDQPAAGSSGGRGSSASSDRIGSPRFESDAYVE